VVESGAQPETYYSKRGVRSLEEYARELDIITKNGMYDTCCSSRKGRREQ